ncbi:energy-coupled thiamine transporter ThiT [Siminovitchia fortis]|uniref:Energy-coupled thiamine transporter ThiT n=1 Tax=Siminovitchia fortis TaxID=254758 RepID=A0A443J021_9BACI|nr:energy-coupled thiamine transporter ThiT [Siminovitchia fortis]RWR13948.1 energy-coupled thiamine transporter ThiT [Siminovitchia fortis]WHY81203.1 energy-coupled thiamine transporter ThiT [Siminovitchia fortis]
MGREKMSLRALMEVSIFAAFAMMLDMIPSVQITPAIKFSVSMVPIFIVSLRWGIKAGFASGFLWGLLQIVTGDAAGQILTPLQGLIEYFIAFSFIGAAGLLAPAIKNVLKSEGKVMLVLLLLSAVLIGGAARYIWHFIAGIIFWGQYAPPGQSAFLYSLIANGTSCIASSLACFIVIALLTTTAPRLLQVK